jgi:hypothetical protein
VGKFRFSWEDYVRKTAIIRSLVATFAIAAIAGTSSADRPLETPTKNAFGGEGLSPAAFFFGTGFEAGEGFVNGNPIEPQMGFTASGTNHPFASVRNVNPFSGSQHLRIVRNTAAAAGAQHVVLTPLTAQAAGTPSTVYMRINLSNDGGADYDIAGQAPSQGFITWRVKFHFNNGAAGPGTIFVLDDLGAGLVFVNTNVVWAEGVYKELRVDFDPANGEQRYYYDGALIYTSIIYAGTAVEQVVWVHDNFQLANETGDFDGLSVQTLGEPSVGVEPTTWGAFKSLMR